MNNWEEIAVNLLNKSLNTVPQELNELDWKCALSTNTERLAQHISAIANYPGGGFHAIGINNVSFASKIIADTIESGLIKPSDPDNGSKKFASYIPFWA